MLTQMDVMNARGGTLSMPLALSGFGYVIKEIDGLGPIKAALTSASMAQNDGAQLLSARRDIRNITGKLGFQSDYAANTVAALRAQLYDYMLPKQNVTLSFFIDGVLYATTLATVEDLDDTRFTQDPEMDFSFICPDPDFYAPVPLVANGVTISTSSTASVDIPYSGTSDTGGIFVLTVTAATTTFTINESMPDGTLRVFNMQNMTLVAGDVVTVNSITGQKSVTLNRAGVISSLLWAKDPKASWPRLSKGDNMFAVMSPSTGMAYSFTYTPKFAGL